MKLCVSLMLISLSAVYTAPDVFGRSATTSCNCGWINRGRIVGGKETRKNEFPAMVTIQYAPAKEHVCGGTILTPWHILTAAHCFPEFITAEDIDILVGVHDLAAAKNGQRGQISEIIMHEEFDRKLLHNDIALLVTAEKMLFSQNVGPACFPSSHLEISGGKIKALGWGKMTSSKTDKHANSLMAVDLTVINFDNCTDLWSTSKGQRRPNQKFNMCTFEKRKDTCGGDSGGPLLWLDPEINRYTVSGVVSFGSVCGGKRPGVNTDASLYVDWVNSKIKASKPDVSVCTKVSTQ